MAGKAQENYNGWTDPTTWGVEWTRARMQKTVKEWIPEVLESVRVNGGSMVYGNWEYTARADGVVMFRQHGTVDRPFPLLDYDQMLVRVG